MRRDVLLLLCSFYLLPLGAHADDSGLSAKDIKTLFFGHDERKAVSRPEESPWDAIGQLETASESVREKPAGAEPTLRSMTDSEVRIFGKIDAVEYVR